MRFASRRWALLSFSVLALLALAAPAHAAVTWTDTVRISELNTAQRALAGTESAAVNTTGTAVGIWRADTPDAAFDQTARSAFRPSPTGDWGAPQVAGDPSNVLEPKVVIDDDGNALAAWLSERSDSKWAIFASYRPGNTGVWSAPELVTREIDPDPGVTTDNGGVAFLGVGPHLTLDMNASGQAIITYHWIPDACAPDELHRLTSTDGAGWAETVMHSSGTSECPGAKEGLYPQDADINDAGGAVVVAQEVVGGSAGPTYAATHSNDPLAAWSSFGVIAGDTPPRFIAGADVDASGNARVIVDIAGINCTAAQQCLYEAVKPVSGAWSGETAIPNTLGWHAHNIVNKALPKSHFAPNGRGVLIVQRTNDSSTAHQWGTMALASGSWSAPVEFALDTSPDDEGFGVWDATAGVAPDGTQHVVYADVSGGPGDVDYNLLARSRTAAGSFNSAVTAAQHLDNSSLSAFIMLPLMVDGSARPTLVYNWNEELFSARGSGTPDAGGGNTAPVLTESGPDLAYTEGDGDVPVDANLTLDDPDDNSIASGSRPDLGQPRSGRRRAQVHESARNHRVLQRRDRPADPHRDRFGGRLPDGAALGHVREHEPEPFRGEGAHDRRDGRRQPERDLECDCPLHPVHGGQRQAGGVHVGWRHRVGQGPAVDRGRSRTSLFRTSTTPTSRRP